MKIIRSILNEPEMALLDDIHELRVNIKKQRAIIALINFSSQNFTKKKYLKPYKKIFKQAGKVRNLEIEESVLQRIEGHEKLENYLREVTMHLENERRKWILLSSNNKSKKLKKSFTKIIPYFKNINGKSISNFIKRKRKYILKFIEPKRWKKKHLHKFRKKLKVLNYIIKVSHSNNKKIKEDIGYIQKLIGDWHDYVVIVKHLNKAIDSVNISTEEKETLIIIKRQLKLEEKELYVKIKCQKDKLSHLIEHV